jgi:hypothetical protein
MNTDIQMAGDDEYQLPCAEALLAGTLALMTGHAQACCDGHRQLMTRKIVSNLSQLTEHPILSPQFRAALWNLRTHWQALQEQKAMEPAQGDQRLWHTHPTSVQ